MKVKNKSCQAELVEAGLFKNESRRPINENVFKNVNERYAAKYTAQYPACR